MPALTPDYISERWPKLFHMAEAGSWESIAHQGLLSTSALLDLFEVTGADREAIESRKRNESVALSHPQHGTAVIRDNKPIIESVLRRTLVGMSEDEWYRTLNGRVFFWLSENRLDRLRLAGEYADREHDILTIDTHALLKAHAHEVELATLNTGAVHAAANYPRGAGSFIKIADFPFADRVRSHPGEPIVELTVPYSVPDIAQFVLDISRR